MNRRLHPSFPSFSLFLFLLALFGAVSPAAAGWRLVGPAGSYVGSVALPLSPVGTLYASGYDTILRSADGGATFSSFAVPNDICPFLSTPIVAPDPSQTGALYASDRGNLWKTSDGGATWRAVSSPDIGWISDLTVLPDAPGHLLAVADASIYPPLSPSPPCYAGAAGSGVALSRDGGETWSVVRPVGSGTYQVATFDPAHVERLYLGTTASDLFLSADGGATLKALDFPVHGGGIEDLRIDSTTVPGTLFARAGGQYYRAPLLADGTVGPWTNLTRAPENQFPAVVHRNLVLDPNQPGTLYTFTNRGVYASTDRGDTWTDITGGDIRINSLTALALDPRPGGPLYAATRQGLYVLDRSSCSDDAAGACLNNFRFRVSATFRTPGGPITPAHVQALSADTADFWFFSPGNVELIVKVLDGRAVNGDFWVFGGGLSDVEYTLTVTDTVTGTLRSYTKAAGKLESFADTSYPASAVAGGSGKGADLPLAIDPFLLPDAAAGCNPGSTTLCLAGSRFQVSVSYEAGPFAGAGRTVPLTPDTGAFWFLSPDNVELVVKVLDGRALNGHFWVFYGALSDVAYTLTVTDTATGAVRTYTNHQGHLASVADTRAF